MADGPQLTKEEQSDVRHVETSVPFLEDKCFQLCSTVSGLKINAVKILRFFRKRIYVTISAVGFLCVNVRRVILHNFISFNNFLNNYFGTDCTIDGLYSSSRKRCK